MSGSPHSGWVVLPLVATMALSLACLARAEPVTEEWYETLLAGHRIGVVGRTAATEGDTLLVTIVTSDVAVERLGDLTEMSQKDVWTETSVGRAIRYVSTRVLSEGEETSLVVEVGGDALSLRKSTKRGSDSWTLPVRGELLFPRAVSRLHADRGFVPGDSYAYVTFDPDFEAASRCSVLVMGPETLHVAGERMDLNLLHVWPDVYEGVLVREWHDESGEFWAQDVPELGVETRRVVGGIDLAGSSLPDVVSGTMIRVAASMPRPELVDEALYEVWLDGADVAGLVEGDLRQRVEGRTERGLLLRVRRTVPGRTPLPETEAAGTTSGTDLASDVVHTRQAVGDEGVEEEYLEGNVLVQKDDPDVREAALGAVADVGPDHWEMAVAIERKVAELITDRGYGTALASAAEVIDTRSGDCSEHALLAAAMARAVGIPSRLATGLVHFSGGFAYHMWVEVWVGDAWYALDPTQGRGSVDAAHIRLGSGSLAGGRVAELSLPVLRTAGKLGLRIVEYEEAGTMHRP